MFSFWHVYILQGETIHKTTKTKKTKKPVIIYSLTVHRTRTCMITVTYQLRTHSCEERQSLGDSPGLQQHIKLADAGIH